MGPIADADDRLHHVPGDCEHGQATGPFDLVQGAGVGALVIVVGLGALHFPLGPSEQVVGRVQSALPVQLSRYHSENLVYVSLGSEVVAVDGLPAGCAVGEPILIQRQRMLWGRSLHAIGCPSAPPT